MDADSMRRRVEEARVARLGTITSDGRPHLVPCCFALDGDVMYTAVDEVKAKSTTALRRLDNIRMHSAVTVLVDHYDDDDWSTLWWVRLDGTAKVLDATSPEGHKGVDLLVHKYPQYRAGPVSGPVVCIEITRWSAWP